MSGSVDLPVLADVHDHVIEHLTCEAMARVDSAALVIVSDAQLARRIATGGDGRSTALLDLGGLKGGIDALGMHHDALTCSRFVAEALAGVLIDDEPTARMVVRQAIIGAAAIAESENRAPTLLDACALLDPDAGTLRAYAAGLCERDPLRGSTADFLRRMSIDPAGPMGDVARSAMSCAWHDLSLLLHDLRVRTFLAHPCPVDFRAVLRERRAVVITCWSPDLARWLPAAASLSMQALRAAWEHRAESSIGGSRDVASVVIEPSLLGESRAFDGLRAVADASSGRLWLNGC